MPRTKRDESAPLRDGDNFDVMRGLMVIEVPCDLPSEKLRAGDHVTVQQGEAIPDGAFGLVRIHSKGCLALARICQLDPTHVRVGGADIGGDVYPASDIELIGPVVSSPFGFVPLGPAESEAAISVFTTAFPDDDEWPDVIEG